MWSLTTSPISVYPRPCGGASTVVSSMIRSRGLSPPVRGSPGEELAGERHDGSIPARAGEPRTCPSWRAPHPVYPRPCGGAHPVTFSAARIAGLSPPVRGSHPLELRGRAMPRSIPARAGEPDRRWCAPRCGRVYPRPCGGAQLTRYGLVELAGLSPPVRGSQLWMTSTGGLMRSIPARAGEPSIHAIDRDTTPVYPRPCGGAP